ncbi:MAG: hypothetical protein WAW42_03805 [Candidatus Competibacteraceae bacterium]
MKILHKKVKLLILAVFIISGITIFDTTTNKGICQIIPPDSPQNLCYTYAWFVLEFECGSGKILGPAFGVWGCSDKIGLHKC